jgi:hypothetical protein
MNRNQLAKSRVLRRFDQLLVNLNIVLVTVAFCLFVLDTTIFATLIISNEFLSRRGIGMTSSIYALPAAGFRGFTESW